MLLVYNLLFYEKISKLNYLKLITINITIKIFKTSDSMLFQKEIILYLLLRLKF